MPDVSLSQEAEYHVRSLPVPLAREMMGREQFEAINFLSKSFGFKKGWKIRDEFAPWRVIRSQLGRVS